MERKSISPKQTDNEGQIGCENCKRLEEINRDLYEACKAIWEAHGKSRLDYGTELVAEISKLDTLLAKAEEVL